MGTTLDLEAGYLHDTSKGGTYDRWNHAEALIQRLSATKTKKPASKGTNYNQTEHKAFGLSVYKPVVFLRGRVWPVVL